jgi:hypothetical protein
MTTRRHNDLLDLVQQQTARKANRIERLGVAA